jgi:hypothetical protein
VTPERAGSMLLEMTEVRIVGVVSFGDGVESLSDVSIISDLGIALR